MSLDLDKRQRAMLREIGVRVWQATAPRPEASDVSINLVAESARPAGATAITSLKEPGASKTAAIPSASVPGVASPRPGPTQSARAPASRVDAAPAARAASAGPAWLLGDAQALYAETAAADGARWLVLAETPAASLHAPPFQPFDGDAGRLLGNMLRAARLHQAGQVLLAPLARLAAGGADGSAGADLSAALPELLAHARPDVILVMGRLAAQAVLQSSEPLGKLRGQVHALHGAKVVVTYDAAYLLRSPLEKARAWDDLCLAIEVSTRAARRKTPFAIRHSPGD